MREASSFEFYDGGLYWLDLTIECGSSSAESCIDICYCTRATGIEGKEHVAGAKLAIEVELDIDIAVVRLADIVTRHRAAGVERTHATARRQLHGAVRAIDKDEIRLLEHLDDW